MKRSISGFGDLRAQLGLRDPLKPKSAHPRAERTNARAETVTQDLRGSSTGKSVLKSIHLRPDFDLRGPLQIRH